MLFPMIFRRLSRHARPAMTRRLDYTTSRLAPVLSIQFIGDDGTILGPGYLESVKLGKSSRL